MAAWASRTAFRLGRGVVAPVRRALQSTPPPEPPTGWVQQVLADLVAVDVERWRRFDGILVRTDECAGERWTLELRHGRSVDRQPGGMATWWRGGANGTVPELLGTLSIERAAQGHPVSERTVPVRVDLIRTHGEIVATLTLRGTGLTLPDESYAVSAPAPAPEGVTGVAADYEVASQTAWEGFPGPVTTVRPQVPITRVVGATVYLHDLADLALEPDELLLTIAGDGAEPILLMRLTADGPLEDRTPEHFADGSWNSANAIDMDYPVEQVVVEADVLTLSGKDWLAQVAGANLQVVVEQLV